jgi:hypothetical protein
MEIIPPRPPAAPVTRDQAMDLIDDARALLEPLMVEGAASLTHPANVAQHAMAPVVRCLWDSYPLADVLTAARQLSETMPRRFHALARYVQDVCAAIAE